MAILSESKLPPPYNQVLFDTQYMLGQEQIVLDRLVLSEKELQEFASLNLSEPDSQASAKPMEAPKSQSQSPEKAMQIKGSPKPSLFRLPK